MLIYHILYLQQQNRQILTIKAIEKPSLLRSSWRYTNDKVPVGLFSSVTTIIEGLSLVIPASDKYFIVRGISLVDTRLLSILTTENVSDNVLPSVATRCRRICKTDLKLSEIQNPSATLYIHKLIFTPKNIHKLKHL